MEISEVKAVLANLLEQVEQMRGLFPDEDGAIASAVAEAYEALGSEEGEEGEEGKGSKDATTMEVEGFVVRIVHEGDRYGLRGCLVHDHAAPLVEFYDATLRGKEGFAPYGQFVSRYYAETLMAGDYPQGLALDGGVPEWSVSPSGMRSVKRWLGMILCVPGGVQPEQGRGQG